MNPRRTKIGPPQLDGRAVQAMVITLPLLIAVVLLMFSTIFRNSQDRAFNQVRTTHLLSESLDRVMIFLEEAQAAARAAALTGSLQPALPFFFQKANLSLELLVLRQMLRATPIDQAEADRVVQMARARAEQLNRTVHLVEAGQLRVAQTETVADLNAPDAHELRRTIAKIDQSVDAIVAQRHQDLLTRIGALNRLSNCLLVISVLVLIAAGLLVLRLRKLQSLITICAWTQRVNYKGKWMRMEEFLWQRFRVKVSHGISEEAFDGVMGIVGKNLTVSDGHPDKTPD